MPEKIQLHDVEAPVDDLKKPTQTVWPLGIDVDIDASVEEVPLQADCGPHHNNISHHHG